MQKYRFISMDGIKSGDVVRIFDELLYNEMVQHCEFDKSKFVWRIGGDVFLRLKELTIVSVSGLSMSKILGIDAVVLAPGVQSNWIFLDEKTEKEKENNMKNERKLVGDLVHGYTYVDAADYEAKREAAMKEVERKISADVINMLRRKAHEEAHDKMNRKRAINRIKKVIFNDPATIVYWYDGTKTVVKAEGEPFDPEKGLAMAITKRFFGNSGWYYEIFKKWLPKEEKAKTQSEEQEAYLSVKEFAEKAGVSESTIRKQLRNGDFPYAEKVDGKWQIPYSEV